MRHKFFLIALSILILSTPLHTDAGLVDDLKKAIKERTENLRNLDKEIREYEVKVQEIGKERQSLETTVSQLTASVRRLESELNSAESQVVSAELTIDELEKQIRISEEKIAFSNSAIAEAIRKIDQNDSNTIIEAILANKSLSEFWSDVDTLQQFQLNVSDKMATLIKLKQDISAKRSAEQQEKLRLLELQQEIAGKRQAVAYTKAEKDKLLAETRSEEQSYQSLLEEKRRLREQFESELSDFENQLNIALNPSTIPTAQSSTLLWPVDNLIITQYFGYTAFAASGAYSGKGHNGVDFGVPTGTPIKAARAGVVKGFGDTDLACPNASYGKWVLVEHDNGLSTLYAHLSVISVQRGQQVTTGQVVGYSGNTGYSTGPHLHFTVYATDGMRIDNLPSRGCAGAVYTIPVANPEAYLNPMQYLPR